MSSAFFMHPTIASTPVPEGVTLRFSPTAVNGYVSWILEARGVVGYKVDGNILISFLGRCDSF